MLTIHVGGNRRRLRRIAEALAAACDAGGDVRVDVEGWDNLGPSTPAVIAFSNDDMEDRDDLAPTTVLVEVVRS